jgi:hypothetical protein
VVLGLYSLYPSGAMIVAAPHGAPRGESVTKNSKKNSLPAVPRRGPEAGILRIEDDFHDGCELNRFMSVSTKKN